MAVIRGVVGYRTGWKGDIKGGRKREKKEGERGEEEARVHA